MQHPAAPRRLIEKLIREIRRAEAQAIEHVPREARRLGADAAPIAALRAVAAHAAALRPRFEHLLGAYELGPRRGVLAATFVTIRDLMGDRASIDRPYRAVLVDLRHGVDVVRACRDAARRQELFGLIRWCDDWLAGRRRLVAGAEAQLAWFADLPALPPAGAPAAGADDYDDFALDDDLARRRAARRRERGGTTIAPLPDRHDQDA